MEAGLGDPGLEIVADRLPGDAAEIREGADMRRDPIWQLLAPHRLGVGEIRRAQDGDEDLYRDDLASKAIDDLASAAGKVDKQLLAGDMGLAHGRLQPTCPAPVQIAKPGISEPVGRTGPVLLPQQCQGYIGAAQLAMHPRPVGHRALIPGDRRRRREQQRFQLLVIEICRQRPAHAGGAGPAEIAADRSLAQPQALRNPPLRQLAGKPQSQNFPDLAHRHSLGRHLVPLLFGKGASLPSVESCRPRGPLYPHFALLAITESSDHLRPESVITFHRIG